MPSPIAHLGAGYAIYRYYKNRLPEAQRQVWKVPLHMFLIAGLSMLPDLDIIPAILFRDMRAYHNNISHSLLFGVPVALVIAGLFQRIYRTSFWLWFVISLVSYDLHVIMDA
ncbi:MAG TPA: metal-dependent hydrolase, partial [Anaerolineales bacterium]|nr:metal-dependent hydrolase [Anaerolineales bacterium]